MPFDYNSFMKGLITGMQLPRTPGNILPPLPPVPSDQYILTESGVYVLTEQAGKVISLRNGGTLPITVIDYRDYLYWVVHSEDVPSSQFALTPGTYVIEETGKTIEFIREDSDLNWVLKIEGLTPVAWSAAITDPYPPNLYFFKNTTDSNRPYALLLYRRGDENTLQLPMYFSYEDFNKTFFFGTPAKRHRMKTE